MMEFDAPRNRTLTAEPLAAHSAKAHLSALADTLEKSGMRARIIDRSTGPDVMRCWNPQVMCTSLEVTCRQHPERDELAFSWAERSLPPLTVQKTPPRS